MKKYNLIFIIFFCYIINFSSFSNSSPVPYHEHLNVYIKNTHGQNLFPLILYTFGMRKIKCTISQNNINEITDSVSRQLPLYIRKVPTEDLSSNYKHQLGISQTYAPSSWFSSANNPDSPGFRVDQDISKFCPSGSLDVEHLVEHMEHTVLEPKATLLNMGSNEYLAWAPATAGFFLGAAVSLLCLVASYKIVKKSLSCSSCSSIFGCCFSNQNKNNLDDDETVTDPLYKDQETDKGAGADTIKLESVVDNYP